MEFYNCCEESTVEINERNFLVNNERYFIKGVCYDPVPLGYKKRSFDRIDEDLKLMVEAGVNTIRVYSPIDDISILDKIDKAGIKIIVGFGYNQEGYYDILSGSFENYSRDELKDIIKSKGGLPSSSISSNTDFLIYGEKAGSKYKKALDLGIELITETKLNEFLKI